jgi:hypothetical protein
MHRCENMPYFFSVFLFYGFWIFSLRYSLLFHLSFSISSYSCLLVLLFLSLLILLAGASLRLLILLLLYFKLFVVLQTCILMIYTYSSFRGVFREGQAFFDPFGVRINVSVRPYVQKIFLVLFFFILLFIYLLIILYCTIFWFYSFLFFSSYIFLFFSTVLYSSSSYSIKHTLGKGI